MKTVFTDTQFWVAIINPRDQWHERALEAEASLIEPFYITSEAVLSEVLAFFCEYGAEARLKAAATVELILSEPNTEVVTVSHEIFLDGLKLYKKRPDKNYSLTDCISMNICRTRGIAEVLTHDHHFTQENLTVLM
jgi:predicted nucleic acid-binding protein